MAVHQWCLVFAGRFGLFLLCAYLNCSARKNRITQSNFEGDLLSINLCQFVAQSASWCYSGQRFQNFYKFFHLYLTPTWLYGKVKEFGNAGKTHKSLIFRITKWPEVQFYSIPSP